MTQPTVLENILEAISSNESLRDALRAHFLPSLNQNTRVGRQHVDAPITATQQTNPELPMQMYQSGSNTALAAQMHQSGNANSHRWVGVNDNPLVSHIRQLENSNPAVTGNPGRGYY